MPFGPQSPIAIVLRLIGLLISGAILTYFGTVVIGFGDPIGLVLVMVALVFFVMALFDFVSIIT